MDFACWCLFGYSLLMRAAKPNQFLVMLKRKDTPNASILCFENCWKLLTSLDSTNLIDRLVPLSSQIAWRWQLQRRTSSKQKSTHWFFKLKRSWRFDFRSMFHFTPLLWFSISHQDLHVFFVRLSGERCPDKQTHRTDSCTFEKSHVLRYEL